MIPLGADGSDSDALPLDDGNTPVHVPDPRRVMIRGDLVDGECIARPSVLPSSVAAVKRLLVALVWAYGVPGLKAAASRQHT